MKSIVIAIVALCVTQSEVKESLERALYWSQDVRTEWVQAVYRPPSQRLREAADEMDRKDSELGKAREVLHRLENYGVCTEVSH